MLLILLDETLPPNLSHNPLQVFRHYNPYKTSVYNTCLLYVHHYHHLFAFIHRIYILSLTHKMFFSFTLVVGTSVNLRNTRTSKNLL